VDALAAVVSLAAITGPSVLVLRDVAAFGRPAVVQERPAPVAAVAPPVVAPPVVVREPEPVREQVTEVIRVSEREQQRDSVLASLTHTETDDHSALRRVGALLVLLTLTLLTAALVGAGIYRVVSALG
jgi:hypothetical protein